MRPKAVAFAVVLAWMTAAASHAHASELGDRDRERDRPEPLTLVVGAGAGQLAGLTTTDAVWRAVRLYEGVLPSAIGGVDGISIARVGARVAIVALVDAPLAEIVGSVQHEVFGHGARARELGLDAESTLVLPRPYSWIVSGQGGGAGTEVPRIQIVAPALRAAVHGGGIEANHAHATIVARRAFSTGSWNGRGDAMLYLGSRLVYAPSFFSNEGLGGGLDTPQAGDVRAYVGAITEDARLRRSSSDARTHLRIAYLWNFFDPLLVSATVAAVRFLATGENRAPVFGLALGSATLLPRPTFALTPFGPERGIGAWLRSPSSIAELGMAMTSFGGVDTARVTTRYERRWRTCTWSAAAQIWSQPALPLALDDRRASLGEMRLGGTVAATAAWDADAVPFGMVAQLGAKTTGFAEALPLEGGPYAYVGARIRMP